MAKKKFKILTLRRKIMLIVLLLAAFGILSLFRGGEFSWNIIASFLPTPPESSTSRNDPENEQQQRPEEIEVAKQESVQLTMRYENNDLLYLANHPCPSKKEFVQVVEKLKKMHNGKDLNVVYRAHKDDPFEESDRALQYLRDNGFDIKIDRMGDND